MKRLDWPWLSATYRGRAGYWAMECPVCKVSPPQELSGGIRWKWMSFHLAEHLGFVPDIPAASSKKESKLKGESL